MTPRTATTRILVVDDEPSLELLVRQRFRRQIQDGSYTFRFATNGQEARQAMQDFTDIDVVLLDINMPDINGLTLLNEFTERLPTCRVVMVSAYGDMNNIRTAMNRGAFDFVTKPINFNDLALTINKTAQHVQHLREAIHAKAVAELKARFFDNITHEFRTPLSLIIAPTDILLQQPHHDALTRHSLLTIRRNGRNLLNLINQLLDLAKLEANQLPVMAQRGDVVAFVGQLIEPFLAMADQKNLTLSFTASRPVCEATFDADKWGKILTNLLANAVKFTPLGGQITIQITLEPASAQLTVSDTGIGIAPEHLPHIFDRFYQVDASMTRAYEGSGIGLALASELVDRLGGTMHVTSTPGQGTTFTVQLPLGVGTGHEPALSLTQPGQADYLLRVPANRPDLPEILPADLPVLLVVEDNTELLAFLAESLAGSFRVLTATDGQEGLDTARRELPDLVVSDVMMPRLNGYQLTQTLKTDPATDHIAVVLLTAHTAPAHRHEGLEKGADDYLDKPFDLDELRLRLRNLVARQQALRDHYQRQAGLPAQADYPVVPTDAFLAKLHTIIEDHLDESDFRAETLADAVTMSSRTLTRKLSTLAGISPARLIRLYRLWRATDLLQAGHSVSETAYLVGFEHPANFATAFKEVYQKTPTEFIGLTA